MSDKVNETSKNTGAGNSGAANPIPSGSTPAKGNGPLGVRVRVDHPNRELYVSTTRAVAGVSVASFCGLLIGVVALSRNTTHSGPVAARASDTPAAVTLTKPAAAAAAEPVERRATPGVSTPVAKAVTPRPVQVAVTNAAGKPAPLVTSTPVKQAAPPTTAPSAQAAITPATQPSAAPNATEGRIIGQTYFVFGSFPKSADAKVAAERLREHGVTCTVERNLPGWTHKGWYSVVSVNGFESSKDAGCQRELKALRAKSLEPHPYRWRTVQGA